MPDDNLDMTSFFARIGKGILTAGFVLIVVVVNLAQCGGHLTVTDADAPTHARAACDLWRQAAEQAPSAQTDPAAASHVSALLDSFKKETSAAGRNARYTALDQDATRLITALAAADSASVSASVASINGRCAAI